MLAISTLFDRRHAAVSVHVAGTGTVAEFGNCVVNRCRLFVFLVRSRFIIVGMATCAVRGICRAWIRHRLCVALMAVDTI